MPLLCLRRGEPDVAVDVDHRFAGGGRRGEVDRRELLTTGQRCPGDLGATEDPFLVVEPVDVPVLDLHPDLAGDQVGTVPHPLLVGIRTYPDVLVDRGSVVGVDVVRAVLEPHQVSWRALPGAGCRRPAEAELGPAQHGRPAGRPDQVADGVEDDLRVVGAGLDAQVAAGDRLAHHRIPWNDTQRPQRSREVPGQAEPVVEHGGAEPNRDGQRVRPEVHRLAGVLRRLFGLRLGVRDRFAGSESRRHGRPSAEHLRQFQPVGGGDVQRGEHQPLLLRGGDPGLVLAVERHHGVRPADLGRRSAGRCGCS